MFQKDCALVQWFMARTADGRPQTRKTMIVALAANCSSPFGAGDNRRNPRRHDLAASSVITAIDPIIT